MDSRLYLQTVRHGNGTRLEDVYCTAPYKIMRPFVRGDRTDLMVMAASAGLLAGDTLDAEYRFADGSNAAVYTQGYEKVFNTGEGHVERRIRLQVGENARVRFLPQPVIPFAGSDLRSQTQIALAGSCRFAYAEIMACGRAGRGEQFQLRRLDSRLQVTVDGRMAFAEHTRLEP
ncbi:MAG: urease accessory protein UreD, partial [Butyricicoccus sp.]|nr:urease accessory protein UreD [Butyricicoccus sp.]